MNFKDINLKASVHALFFAPNTSSVSVQVFRFAIVGGTCFVIDILVFTLLERVFHLHYSIAAVFSFLLSVLANWYLSQRWVFKQSRIAKKKIELILFVIFAVIGLLFNQLVLWIGIDLLHYDSVLVKSAATILVAIWNFVIRKLVLFK